MARHYINVKHKGYTGDEHRQKTQTWDMYDMYNRGEDVEDQDDEPTFLQGQVGFINARDARVNRYR